MLWWPHSCATLHTPISLALFSLHLHRVLWLDQANPLILYDWFCSEIKKKPIKISCIFIATAVITCIMVKHKQRNGCHKNLRAQAMDISKNGWYSIYFICCKNSNQERFLYGLLLHEIISPYNRLYQPQRDGKGYMKYSPQHRNIPIFVCLLWFCSFLTYRSAIMHYDWQSSMPALYHLMITSYCHELPKYSTKEETQRAEWLTIHKIHVPRALRCSPSQQLSYAFAYSNYDFVEYKRNF